MLKIIRGQANTVITTFTERTTLSPVYYLWRVKREQGLDEKTFITPTDLSSYTSRFNKFTITESDTENVTNGTVKLTSGRYYYWVYQQSSSTNTDYTLASSLVEEGLMNVFDTPQQAYIEPTYTEQIYTR